MIKKRISISKLERLNRNPASFIKTNDNRFLSRYLKMVNHALYLNDKGKLTKERMKFTFPARAITASNIIKEIKENVCVFTTIDLEIYARLQTILYEINNKEPMRMDIFLEVLISWFIYTYHDNIDAMTKGDPFYIPNEILKKKKLEKKEIINKFDKEFSKYYKNIITKHLT